MSSSSTSTFSVEIPKLSILLATKDQAPTLERCLQGIFSQTFKNYELIILNDGSTDSTPQILERFKRLDPRIRLFSHRTTQGVIPTYKKLLERAQGEFIWHAASDDFCVDQDFLANGFRLLAKFPQAAGFFCNTLRIIMPAGEPHGIWGTRGQSRYIPPRIFLSQFLLGKIVVPGCSAIVRKNAFMKQGGFSKEAGPLCDLLINSKLGSSFGMIFTGKVSMHSSVYTRNINFGSSFDPWHQLKHLAFLEAKLRKTKYKQKVYPNENWPEFRYLYLGKFFGLEHRFRFARKNLCLEKNLRRLAENILLKYTTQLSQFGNPASEKMSPQEFLSFPFRKPFSRCCRRILSRVMPSLNISI